MAPEDLMQLAIDKCREGIASGQTPFGCAIALNDQVVAVNHNTVWLTTDTTAHAEINAIRAANQATGQIHLEDAMVATTCEPCPMCAAALHWARVGTIYYGASIDDAKQAGFNELQFPAFELLSRGEHPIDLQGGLLVDQCRELFNQWKADHAEKAY